jgi:ABC-type nitrate/sulfonate/bicarbonate transport system permease component
MNYLRTFPLLALVTIFLVWFGRAEIGKYVFIVFAISVIIFVNTVSAIRNIDPIYTQFARTLGATRLQIVRTVYVKGIMPELFGGIRVILGTAWAIVLAAEFIAAQKGLGHILIMSQLYFSPGRMIVILIVFMVYSVIINLVATLATGYFIRWKEK